MPVAAIWKDMFRDAGRDGIRLCDLTCRDVDGGAMNRQARRDREYLTKLKILRGAIQAVREMCDSNDLFFMADSIQKVIDRLELKE